MASLHQPVLLKEVIEYLNPQANQNFIDCTFGGGGHAQAILDRIKPDGKLLGIDANPDVIQTKILNLEIVNNNFVKLKEIYEQHFPYAVDGILFDLGLSTPLIEESGRGFSFQKDEALDMRFDPNKQDLTAAEVVNSYSRDDLYSIFKDYGEYEHAGLLAKGILKHRKKDKFKTTKDLVDVVLKAHFYKGRVRIHPATKVFQALRIEVNNELENLKRSLVQAMDILSVEGRIVVISFHSLEDRIVKNYFRDWSKMSRAKLLVKKPVIAKQEEIENNPKARSAKLRAIYKTN